MNAFNQFEIAMRNAQSGVIEEPRAYYDVISVPNDGTLGFGHPGAFANGEAHPVRITHLTAAMALYTTKASSPALVDERYIQHVGLSLKSHDTFYLSEQPSPLSAWSNEATACADRPSMNNNVWRFERPYIFSPKDTLQVRVSRASPSGTTVGASGTVGVTFAGIGLLSQRPYMFGGSLSVSGATWTTNNYRYFSPEGLRNEGTEPIAIYEMSHGLTAGGNDTYPGVYSYNINVRGVGKATNAWWFSSSMAPGYSYPDCPGALLGPHVGRAVVHKLPNDGFVWNPADEVSVQIRQFGSIVENETARVMIGLLGYTAVA